VKPENNFQGTSLLPVENYHERGCIGEALDRKNNAHVYFYREGDYKLIHSTYNERWELYNVKEDPEEKNNIFTTMPDIARSLIEKLHPRIHKMTLVENNQLDHLDELENKSIYIIREAYRHFKPIALLWSIGKDSTTLLWLIRKAFYGKIPFPVIHIDTTYKFPQMYTFRDHYAKEWNLNLLIEKNEDALRRGISYDTHDAFTCCHELKTVALQQAIKKHKFQALFVGIRRDEHNIRSKERYFSPRDKEFQWNYKDQPPELWEQFRTSVQSDDHIRVHPLLHWTELDIWQYIKREGIPICELYFATNGKRYRSLGCMPITNPIDSDADTVDKIIDELKATKGAERAGRAQDKEQAHTMQRLRALGYM
jgi:sulfate adenylyltransferase subunit 2